VIRDDDSNNSNNNMYGGVYKRFRAESITK
jgi:hypothetical protein